MKFKLFLIYVIICNVSFNVKASECYRYHTPQNYKLYKQGNQLVFQHTTKDPNGVSYVSQKTLIIANIKAEGFAIVNEDDEVILFKTDDGYFLLEKKIDEVKNYGVNKLGSLNQVQEVIGTNFVCVAGRWNYITVKSYSEDVIKKRLENVPLNLEEIADSKRGKVLFKNDKKVYLFSSDDFTFNVIPSLDPKSTQFVKTEDRFIYFDVLYDEDTFYTIDHHFNTTNHTTLLSKFKAFKGFKNATIEQYDGNLSIDTKDGYIWVYLSGGKTFEGIGTVKFVPLEAKFINKYKQFISVKGKIYNNLTDAILKWGAMDVSFVKKVDSLRKEGARYTDGIQNYGYNYMDKVFSPITTLNREALYYPVIGTYNYLGNREMYVDDKTIYFLNNKNKFVANKNHGSPIKNLKLAYAYDDKLWIENQEIQNISNREGLEFFGSIVDVIRECDGGKGQFSVKIDVYYFFKDKHYLYVCNTSNLKMRIIKDFEIKTNELGRFKQLEILMNLEKA